MRALVNKILSRARVDRQLDQIFGYPLTVIRAPMGFGKTTALREYLRLKEIVPIWLPLLGSGGSLDYCWERLTAQIRKESPDMASRLESLGFPTDAPQMAKIVGLVCEQAGKSTSVVVVDDYQLIDCRQTADLICALCAERIPNLHFVLLAREIEVLPVADLEQRGLCLVVGQETMQFQADEIRAYFALMEYTVSEKTLHHICRWTGGWISGIYLLVRGIRQGLPMGRGEDLNQLLEVNLYSTYDEETKTLLLQLSALDAFTLEQIAYVFEDAEVGKRVLSLIQGNAFITYNNSIAAYKMSDVLQEFLQEKARQNGMDAKPIWRRTGMWFLARNENLLAYDYLYRAGEIEVILRDLDKVDAKDIRFKQFPQIHKIFDGLPAETAQRYPLATLRHIRVSALTSHPSARGELERHLRNMEAHFHSDKLLPAEERSRILGEIHNTWIFVAFNDVHAVVEHAIQAVKYFDGRYSCIVSNSTEFTFGAPHFLYCYYNETGAMRAHTEFIASHFHILARAVEGCGFGSEALVLAEYALETGDFDNVEINAQKAIYQSRMYHQNSIEICASFALARLYLYRGDFEKGERLLIQLAQGMGKQDSSVLNTTLELCLAYINTCYGRVDAIPLWLRENDMGTGDFMFQMVAFPYIVCLRTALLAGDFVRLEVLGQEFHQKFAMYNNCLGHIHGYICSAVAKERLYGMEAGCAELEQALALAAPDNVVMPFGENSAGILPMLQKVRYSKKIPQEFLKRVIQCCEHYLHNMSGMLPATIALTRREREILRMIARGMKHEEIAKALYISVPTVRYHVKNTYQKLEVNNKVSAIQKAKTWNLI